MGVFGIDVSTNTAQACNYPDAVLDLAFELTHYSGDYKVAAVQTLLDTRAAARKEKNWTLADAVRNGLSELGFTVEDTPQGARVSYGE